MSFPHDLLVPLASSLCHYHPIALNYTAVLKSLLAAFGWQFKPRTADLALVVGLLLVG